MLVKKTPKPIKVWEKTILGTLYFNRFYMFITKLSFFANSPNLDSIGLQ